MENTGECQAADTSTLAEPLAPRVLAAICAEAREIPSAYRSGRLTILLLVGEIDRLARRVAEYEAGEPTRLDQEPGQAPGGPSPALDPAGPSAAEDDDPAVYYDYKGLARACEHLDNCGLMFLGDAVRNLDYLYGAADAQVSRLRELFAVAELHTGPGRGGIRAPLGEALILLGALTDERLCAPVDDGTCYVHGGPLLAAEHGKRCANGRALDLLDRCTGDH